MELLTFTIAAGETKRFERAGRYLEIIDSTAQINLFFYDSAGGRADEARNALSGLYIGLTFAAIEVYSETAQTVTLLVTDGNGGSRRQPGLVSIVDTAKSVTLAGRAFIVPNLVAAVAAQNSRSGIWIAAGQSKRAIVERIEFSTSGASATFGIAMLTVAPASLDTAVRSKLAGGAAPVSIQRAFDTVGAGGGTTLYLKTGTSGLYEPKKPIVVRPGYGLIVINNNLNQDLMTAFDVTEEADI